jgi:glycosyltransferase involved in cell wall biosynthesis
VTIQKPPKSICLVPKLDGLGGMVSFQAKLVNGLNQRGYPVSYNLEDPINSAILVIGGTRQISSLWKAKRRGIRIVQRLDGMNWLHHKQKTSVKKYLRAETNNWVLAFIRRYLADKIVYQSHFSKGWWQRIHGDLSISSQIVYNGVDLEVYAPLGLSHPPEDHFRILLVEGHLGKDNCQGVENAISLVKQLSQNDHLPARLTVVGDISSQLKMKFQSELSGLVTWLGIVKREQIPEIDRSAHVLFSVDLNAACPNVVIEALACGLPVVSFDTGALGELVRDGAGRIVDYGSNYWNLEPPQLAPLVKATHEILVNNPPFREAARRRAEAVFGLDEMVETYLQVLLE